jgi:uncharacterized protein (DUF2147 family)
MRIDVNGFVEQKVILQCKKFYDESWRLPGQPKPVQIIVSTARYLGDAGFMKIFVALLFTLLFATPACAQSLTPIGGWLHANKRIRLEIAPCGDVLCGTLVWFRWPNDGEGLPLVDLKNPDPALRARPLLGLTVLSGLRRTGEKIQEDSKIYNPDDGED